MSLATIILETINQISNSLCIVDCETINNNVYIDNLTLLSKDELILINTAIENLETDLLKYVYKPNTITNEVIIACNNLHNIFLNNNNIQIVNSQGKFNILESNIIKDISPIIIAHYLINENKSYLAFLDITVLLASSNINNLSKHLKYLNQLKYIKTDEHLLDILFKTSITLYKNKEEYAMIEGLENNSNSNYMMHFTLNQDSVSYNVLTKFITMINRIDDLKIHLLVIHLPFLIDYLKSSNHTLISNEIPKIIKMSTSRICVPEMIEYLISLKSSERFYNNNIYYNNILEWINSHITMNQELLFSLVKNINDNDSFLLRLLELYTNLLDRRISTHLIINMIEISNISKIIPLVKEYLILEDKVIIIESRLYWFELLNITDIFNHNEILDTIITKYMTHNNIRQFLSLITSYFTNISIETNFRIRDLICKTVKL